MSSMLSFAQRLSSAGESSSRCRSLSSTSDTNGVSGTCRRRCRRDGKLIAFQLYYIKHYRLFGRPCCVRLNLGWKLWGSRDKKAQYVGIYLNPVKGWKL